ncbi:MAG: TerC family protein [Bacteroidales bacterium]|nr:TerC family protein [Bacteroidales bacterium]
MAGEIIIALLTLIALETVLGIDNVIFISILAQRLPQNKQKKAIRLGLIIAMVSRIILLSLISLILRLKTDLFHLFGEGFSGKDLILIIGGLFLFYKATTEIRHKVLGDDENYQSKKGSSTFIAILAQIFVMDVVFSLDSIITAVGLVEHIWVMYVAIVITVGIMMFAAYPISKFVNDHPTFKMLALAFLLLIGFSLVTEGFGIEIPKGYIYFAMFFSLMVDILQMKMKKPVEKKQ